MKNEDQLLGEILAKRNKEELTIVAICGAADLGKSYLSNKLVLALSNQNLKANHLTMDSYLMDRIWRQKKGLSGYDFEAYHQKKIIADLGKLKAAKPIVIQPYNHQEGKKSSSTIEILPSDIIIFDGLHVMHPFLPHLLIFLSFYLQRMNN